MTPQIDIFENELQFSFVRSSGPGGQNVNKLNTKAILRWSPTRSQSLPEEVRQRFLMRYGRRITADGDIIISSQRFSGTKTECARLSRKIKRIDCCCGHSAEAAQAEPTDERLGAAAANEKANSLAEKATTARCTGRRLSGATSRDIADAVS